MCYSGGRRFEFLRLGFEFGFVFIFERRSRGLRRFVLRLVHLSYESRKHVKLVKVNADRRNPITGAPRLVQLIIYIRNGPQAPEPC